MQKLRAGRNDKCPCGSGKKYKKCCLGQPSPELLADLALGKLLAAEYDAKTQALLLACAATLCGKLAAADKHSLMVSLQYGTGGVL